MDATNMWRVGVLLLLSGLSSGVLIPLPGSGRAEGVAHLAGTNFIASDFLTGNIFLIDVESKLVTTIVHAPGGRLGIGVHASREHVFVAGGGPSAGFIGRSPPVDVWMYVYDVATGQDAAACPISAEGFINDVVADDTYAYFTDSILPRIYRLQLSSMPLCNISIISLPPAQFSGSGFFANGIAIYNDGLIVGNSALQTLFYVDFKNKSMVTQIAPEGLLPGVDGILVKKGVFGTLLYVTQNAESKVSIWRLFMKDQKVSISKAGEIVRQKQFASPTTVAVSDDYLVVANLDFSVPFPPPPGSKFNIFALKL